MIKLKEFQRACKYEMTLKSQLGQVWGDAPSCFRMQNGLTWYAVAEKPLLPGYHLY
jgi:hypothetical protein